MNTWLWLAVCFSAFLTATITFVYFGLRYMGDKDAPPSD